MTLFEKPLWKSFRRGEDWTLTALYAIAKSKQRKLKRHSWLVIRIFLISVFLRTVLTNNRLEWGKSYGS